MRPCARFRATPSIRRGTGRQVSRAGEGDQRVAGRAAPVRQGRDGLGQHRQRFSQRCCLAGSQLGRRRDARRVPTDMRCPPDFLCPTLATGPASSSRATPHVRQYAPRPRRANQQFRGCPDRQDQCAKPPSTPAQLTPNPSTRHQLILSIGTIHLLTPIETAGVSSEVLAVGRGVLRDPTGSGGRSAGGFPAG